MNTIASLANLLKSLTGADVEIDECYSISIYTKHRSYAICCKDKEDCESQLWGMIDGVRLLNDMKEEE